MKTITDIYAHNDTIRERLIKTVSNLDDKALSFLPENENWTIPNLVEHISIVDEGICKICSKLVSRAREAGLAGDGMVTVSEKFKKASAELVAERFKAPEMVHPTGKKTIPESLERLAQNRGKLNELKRLFEAVNTSEFTFPHPLFGPLSAAEWLVLRGSHESRHTDQIERILRQYNSQ